MGEVEKTGSCESVGFLSCDSYIHIQTVAKTVRRTTSSEKNLFRGVSINTVLKSCGQILSSSSGTAETYALSKPVKHLDAFISHNWSTPRFSKFLALALHFNYQYALLVMVLVSVSCLFMTATGVMPLNAVSSRSGEHSNVPWAYGDESGGSYQMGLWNLEFGTASFLVAFIVYWDPFGCIGRGSSLVFLDKICIHQTDSNLKRRGIEGLGAFLKRSHSMVIIYTETYLHKLWTVYELAVFLSLHSVKPLVVLPTFLPRYVVAMVLIEFCRLCASEQLRLKSPIFHWHGLKWKDVESVAHYSGVAVHCLNAAFLRYWAQVKCKIQHHVEEFDISQATCFDENDRPLVQHNVASFMKYISRVPPDAPDQDALQAFNILVREELPQALISSFGRFGLPYKYVLCIMVPLLMFGVDVMGADIWMGKTLSLTSAKFADILSRVIALKPLAYAAQAWLMQQVLWMGGCFELLFVLISGFAMWFVYATAVHINQHLWLKAAFAKEVLLALFISMMGLLMLTYWVYRPPQRRRQIGRTGGWRQTSGDVELSRFPRGSQDHTDSEASGTLAQDVNLRDAVCARITEDDNDATHAARLARGSQDHVDSKASGTLAQDMNLRDAVCARLTLDDDDATGASMTEGDDYATEDDNEDLRPGFLQGDENTTRKDVKGLISKFEHSRFEHE